MRVLVLGTPDDTLGFALAGATARAPQSARELEALLAQASEERPPVGLVLVSEPIAALAPRAVRVFRERPGAPPLLVLPQRATHEDAR
jgi:vacuolar-type H+-ATPase subunit F/Vma7